MSTERPDAYRGDNLRDQLFVKVFTVARTSIGRTWNTRDVCSGYWRLYRNDRAGAWLELADGASYSLTPRRVHLVPAWVRFSCRNSRPIDHRYVHFDLIGLTASTVQRLFTKPLMVPEDAPAAALAAALDGRDRPDVAACRGKAAVLAALAAVLARLPAADAMRLASPGPVAPAVRHIEEQLGARLDNGKLAARCHFSEDHFVRIFRQRLGTTPAQYILERRVAAATQALAFGVDSIEQIAERLGFANRFHLTRMFTRRMGIPPAAFRRQVQV
ncbi:MAG: AraC family transcriptional regulator [Lentisphaerae bacterium]|nr:AraC family transcriptional regulator [Lentisphaerota bacterium]